MLGEALAKRGHQAWVIGAGDGPRRLSENRPNLVHHLLQPPTLKGFAEVVSPIKPDLIHIHAHSYAERLILSIRENPELKDVAIVSTPVFGRPPGNSETLGQTSTCVIGAFVYSRLLKWLGISANECANEVSASCV